MASPPLDCNTPLDASRLGQPLPHFARAVSGAETFNVVAIGSSSTEGDGASSPALSYPCRLSVALKSRFPQARISVLNRGIGGQEAADEVARFDRDVLANSPRLVIWQVGTNAAWKGYPLQEVAKAIDSGLAYLQKIQTDTILMNLQYAPALLDDDRVEKPATTEMLKIIAAAASTWRVGLFDRFGIMKLWHEKQGVPFDQMISNFDGNWLHQNDWSYNCIAQALCNGIVYAVDSSPAA
jgi:acyl-CoA thioesterase I